jgi:hypothetical protein
MVTLLLEYTRRLCIIIIVESSSKGRTSVPLKYSNEKQGFITETEIVLLLAL